MKFRKITALLLALLMSFSLLTGCASISQEVKDEVVNSIVDAVVSELENAANAETKDNTSADAETAPDKTEPSQEVPPQETQPSETAAETPAAEPEDPIDEEGEYTSKEDVALYIHTYGHLPENFITKKEAQEMGWTGGSLDPYYYGGSIGGDYFGNYEGQLPKAPGRKWTECDINTMYKKSRGPERIVFSNDGLIYYTGDHYETFEQLY